MAGIDYSGLINNQPFREDAANYQKIALNIIEDRKKKEEEQRLLEEKKRQFEAVMAQKQADEERRIRQDLQTSADEYARNFTSIFDKIDGDNNPEGKKKLIDAYNSSKYVQDKLIPEIPADISIYRKKPVDPLTAKIDASKKIETIKYYNSLDQLNKQIFDAPDEQLTPDQINMKKGWKNDIELAALNRIISQTDKTGKSDGKAAIGAINQEKLNTDKLQTLEKENKAQTDAWTKASQNLDFIDKNPTNTGKFAIYKNNAQLWADAAGIPVANIQKAENSVQLTKALNIKSLGDIKTYLSGPTSDRDILVVKDTNGNITDSEQILRFVLKQNASDMYRSMMKTSEQNKLIRSGVDPITAERQSSEKYNFPLFAKEKLANGNVVAVDFNTFANRIKRSNPNQKITDDDIASAWREYSGY